MRDYKTPPIIFDGVDDCEHEWNDVTLEKEFHQTGATGRGSDTTTIHKSEVTSGFCSKCNAWKGQLGLEPTPELFIKHLLDFFDDVKLKLKDTGNVFVNLGDSYGGGSGGYWKHEGELGASKAYIKSKGAGMPKCLLMVPQRFAWGMIEHGWILRNEIIWAKPNHMPESVTDRLTKAHEVIYHFVKQSRYYYNLDAIREPVKAASIERDKYDRNGNKGDYDRTLMGHPITKGTKYQGKFEVPLDAESFGSPRARTQRKQSDNEDIVSIMGFQPRTSVVLGKQRKHQIGDGYRQGMNRDETEFSIQRVFEVNQKEIAEFLKEHLTEEKADDYEFEYFPEERHETNGWFETKLDEIFGEHKWRHWVRTDESGASLPSPNDWRYLKDVAPWLPNKFDKIMLTVKEVPQVVVANANGKNPGDVWAVNTTPYSGAHFATFPLELVRRPVLAGCPPNGLVLDPFGGSGTVGEFCRHNDRNAILFELNPDYKPLIEKRTMLKIPELQTWGDDATR